MRRIELHRIKRYADDIYHCGDYGQTFIKNDLSEVYVVLGDADDCDLDYFRDYVESIYLTFTVDCEHKPDTEEYTLISGGIEAENYDEEEGDLEEGYLYPKMLMLDEYAKYCQLFIGLDD